MNRGVKSLLLVASVAAASCAAAPEDVKIRAIADAGSKLRAAQDPLAESKAQLALGNVGLALEGFRKASRNYPDNPEAFAGLAACYNAMGRYDLSQSNYEAALALAPRNVALLTALARSLETQGKADAAAEVLAEVAELNAAAAALDQTQAEPDLPVQTATAAPTVTVALPPASQLAAREPEPVQRPFDPTTEVNLGQPSAPHLQRLSLGEVALLTSGGSVWRAKVVSHTPRSVTVRWVPLTMASVRPNIRLLNAARHQGLAARTRDYLLDRGWRKIEIGDAAETRDDSVVLYPAARPGTGRSLAAQFGFRARAAGKGDVFVVMLGRDAIRPAPSRG
jgi:tetratricopeptide (TPR) repeat protein